MSLFLDSLEIVSNLRFRMFLMNFGIILAQNKYSKNNKTGNE